MTVGPCELFSNLQFRFRVASGFLECSVATWPFSSFLFRIVFPMLQVSVDFLCSIGGVCISESFLYTTYLFSASCPPYPDLSPLEDSTIQCNPLLSLLYFVTIGIG